MELSNGKICIAYICGDYVHHAWMQSMFALAAHDSANKKLVTKIVYAQGAYLDINRDRVSRQFIASETKEEWMLALDTDHCFTPEQIYELYDTAVEQKLKILSALYVNYMDGVHLMPVWMKYNKDGDRVTETELDLKKPQKLAAVGMGCCLIHRSVFEKMAAAHEGDPWPWFARDRGTHFGKPTYLGEDICFCKRAEDLGIDTYGFAKISIGHIKQHTESLDTLLKRGDGGLT